MSIIFCIDGIRNWSSGLGFGGIFKGHDTQDAWVVITEFHNKNININTELKLKVKILLK